MYFTAAALSALMGLASATAVTVVHVSNANNSLIFSPSKITAAAGTMVQFQFMAGNHTVTQSTFDNPCQPIGDHSNVTGIHSGFVPVAASSGEIPTYTIEINNTTPIWLYCAQGKHCENGMSMVINENTAKNSSRSLEEYQTLASKATTVVPAGGAVAGTNGNTTASSTAASSSSTATAVSSAGPLLAVPAWAAGLVAVAGSLFL